MVEQILRDFPLSRGMFEYEDYAAEPTRTNASEFITRALEDNYNQIAKKDNYLKYIATRPRWVMGRLLPCNSAAAWLMRYWLIKP